MGREWPDTSWAAGAAGAGAAGVADDAARAVAQAAKSGADDVAQTARASGSKLTASGSPQPMAPKIHAGKQAKHLASMEDSGFIKGKSELTHPDPQSLVDKFAGKGYRKGQREWVDTGETIGIYVDEAGNRVPTTRITIHYDADGTAHVVPAPPTPPKGGC